ncbi:MAG: hypothetical protein HGA85_07645, partial [Nanoarchaeota archaeon]|nr:hypothetical protein [Nanoarchaeota archaeon]
MTSTSHLRYERQKLIKDWKQGNATDASIAIIGADMLTSWTSLPMTCMGIGNTTIYGENQPGDMSASFLAKMTGSSGAYWVEALSNALTVINPGVSNAGMPLKVDSNGLTGIIGKQDAIFHTSNDSEGKKEVYNYAVENNIPLFMGAADNLSFGFDSFIPGRNNPSPLYFEEYDGRTQGAIPSCILGGIMAEEFRKIIIPLEGDYLPAHTLFYNLSSEARFERGVSKIDTLPDLSSKRVLQIGDGGTGSFTGILRAIQGCGYQHHVDFDTVDPTNLQRQVAFYDNVGMQKATSFVEKMQRINKWATIAATAEMFDENTYMKIMEEARPDLIVGCLDGFTARAILNYVAIKKGISYVDGGLDYSSGNVNFYEPGKSQCLDCRVHVDEKARKINESEHCNIEINANIVMTNQIIGGLMAGEELLYLSGLAPSRRRIDYDSIEPGRFGLTGAYS